MEKKVFTVEQMQEIISLGINVKNASMVWLPNMEYKKEINMVFVRSHHLAFNHITSEHYWSTREGKNTYPTFTLDDVLEILKSKYKLVRTETREDSKGNVFYEVTVYNTLRDCNTEVSEVSLRDALFNMLKWAKKNHEI